MFVATEVIFFLVLVYVEGTIVISGQIKENLGVGIEKQCKKTKKYLLLITPYGRSQCECSRKRGGGALYCHMHVHEESIPFLCYHFYLPVTDVSCLYGFQRLYSVLVEVLKMLRTQHRALCIQKSL